MKKTLILISFILCLVLSFFGGKYMQSQQNLKLRSQQSHTLITFAIDKIENLKNQYEQDEMEALISNIYAAYEYTDDGELAGALHDLWNALIFDGENISSREDDLIDALKDKDSQAIKNISIDMRTVN